MFRTDDQDTQVSFAHALNDGCREGESKVDLALQTPANVRMLDAEKVGFDTLPEVISLCCARATQKSLQVLDQWRRAVVAKPDI